MHKALPRFLAIVALVIGLLLVVYVVRFEALRIETTLLMKLAQLENASLGQYEAEFGKALYTVQSVEQLHPELAKAIEGKLTTGRPHTFSPYEQCPTNS